MTYQHFKMKYGFQRQTGYIFEWEVNFFQKQVEMNTHYDKTDQLPALPQSYPKAVFSILLCSECEISKHNN